MTANLPRPGDPGTGTDRAGRRRSPTGAAPAVVLRAVGVRPGARSSTGPVLRRLRTLLVAGTAVALGLAFWAATAMHRTVEVVHGDAVSAVTALDATATAIQAADVAAVTAFSQVDVGQAGLVDTGPDYQDQVAAANQSLAQAAAADVAGGEGTVGIQRVQGLLVEYADLVTRAQGYYQLHNAGLAAAAMWDASHLVHRADSGILVGLDFVKHKEQDAVTDRSHGDWMSWRFVPLWAVPLVLLAALLVGTQRYLRRRLRRVVNPPLLAASVVLLGVLAYTGYLAAAAQHRGRVPLLQPASPVPPAEVFVLVGRTCAEDCGVTLERARSATGQPGGDDAGTVTQPGATGPARLHDAAADRTRPPLGWSVFAVLPAAWVVISGLSWWGLHGPERDYRFVS
jgi:hypothetical protein